MQKCIPIIFIDLPLNGPIQFLRQIKSTKKWTQKSWNLSSDPGQQNSNLGIFNSANQALGFKDKCLKDKLNFLN